LPPTVPTSTIEVITGATSTATTPGSSIGLSTEQLIKAMEELKLQVPKLKQVKEKFAKVE